MHKSKNVYDIIFHLLQLIIFNRIFKYRKRLNSEPVPLVRARLEVMRH